MSYEGHVEAICKHGHLYQYNAYADISGDDRGRVCPAIKDGKICGAEAIFTNDVDDTNGEEYGNILQKDYDKFKLTDREMEECPCCKHSKLVNSETYSIPKKKDKRLLRTFKEFDTSKMCDVYYYCETGAVAKICE